MPNDLAPTDLEQLRPFLFSIAYRMLGNAGEAEDMVQETFLRVIADTPKRLESPKAFLATIVTRLCLDYLKSARVVRAAYHGPWLPEPVLTADLAPGPEDQAASRDDVSLAFLFLLERLTPDERAAFVLREAFDYRYDDIASVLSKSSVAARKLVQRARQRLETPRWRVPVSISEQRQLTERFLRAARHGDLRTLEEVLAADVTTWADGGEHVRAARRPVVGRDRVARQMIGLIDRIFPTARFSLESINGGIGILWWDGDQLISVMEPSIADGVIVAFHAVMNPTKLAYIRQRVTPPTTSVA